MHTYLYLKRYEIKTSIAFQIIDTRSKGRFDGTAPEPEPELYSGHILGSLNIPYTTLISADTKTMKKPDGILEGTHSNT